MRRRQNTLRLLRATFPCKCGRILEWIGYADDVPPTAKQCGDCKARAAGYLPKGLVDGECLPEIWLDGNGTAMQNCTKGECGQKGGRVYPLADLTDAGECAYCAAPGEASRGRWLYKVHDGVVRFPNYDPPLAVVLNPDGTLHVRVLDQSGRRSEMDVALDASPRWASGWYVTDTEGRDRAFRSDWDSSG